MIHNSEKNKIRIEIPHEGTHPWPYQCNQCDKAFSIDNDLKVHMYEHFDEKPCQCNQCDKSFSMHSDLKKTHV